MEFTVKEVTVFSVGTFFNEALRQIYFLRSLFNITNSNLGESIMAVLTPKKLHVVKEAKILYSDNIPTPINKSLTCSMVFLLFPITGIIAKTRDRLQ